MPFTLCDARLRDVTTDIACGSITIDGTRIQSVERPEYSPGQENIIDAAGMIVMPGFIDIEGLKPAASSGAFAPGVRRFWLEPCRLTISQSMLYLSHENV